MMSATPRQILEIHTKRIRNAAEHEHRRVALAAFDPAQIGLMHGRAMSQLLLGEASVTPKLLNIEADSHPQIHGRMAKFGLTSTHRL